MRYPLIACLTLILPAAARAAEPPVAPPPAPVAAGLKLELITRDTTEAVGVVAAPEKPGRLFVVEKRGKIRLLRGTKFDATPFLDFTGKVALEPRDNGEQGLLGLAFHPQFAKNGRFYLNYTDKKGDTRIVEMKVDPKDPNRADAATERQLVLVDQPFANHNAGDLAFGRDGKLYVALGDGGAADDPHGNGQSPKTLLGKLFRLDVDAATPTPEVIGKGLRNPWRYSFDAKTGDLYLADVGQNLWEYVHVAPAAKLTGHNFGWNVVEGMHCFKKKTCDAKAFTRPVVEYSHQEGCSITGGHVYRGKAIPQLDGAYFYSDYCTALVRSFRLANGKVVDSWDWKAALDPGSQLARIAAFGTDHAGELYVVSHDGPIYKLVRR